MTKDNFREWMDTMINGIYSLAKHHLAIERRSGLRRHHTVIPLQEREKKLESWLQGWKHENIQAMINSLQGGRPLRRRNFQYIVNKMNSGKWWPLVSVTCFSASTSHLMAADYGVACQAPP